MLAAVFAAAALTFAPAAPAQGGLVHFQSPSGNINCYVAPAFQGSPAFAQCLARKHTWARSITPRRPASCDLDFDPYTVSLSNRRATVGSCRGDIGPLCVNTSDPCKTLTYGRSVTAGSIRCVSLKAGIECRYRTGRPVGFRIARETYILYR